MLRYGSYLGSRARASEEYSRKPLKRNGSFLVESTVSLFVLVAISVVLLQSSFNILKPRTWTMRTNLVDAYLSKEVALMNSLSFDDIVAGTDSSGVTGGWGTGAGSVASLAQANVLNDEVMGKMPGFTAGLNQGRNYTATVYRLRLIPLVDGAQMNNTVAIPSFRDNPTANTLKIEDAGIKCYELQTHVVYQVGNDTYVKTRSVIRSQ